MQVCGVTGGGGAGGQLNQDLSGVGEACPNREGWPGPPVGQHAEARAGPQGCQEMQGRGRVQGQGEAPDVARHAVETEK